MQRWATESGDQRGRTAHGRHTSGGPSHKVREPAMPLHSEHCRGETEACSFPGRCKPASLAQAQQHTGHRWLASRVGTHGDIQVAFGVYCEGKDRGGFRVGGG